MVETEEMVNREPKVSNVIHIFKETACEPFYFNKVHTFSNETLSDVITKH